MLDIVGFLDPVYFAYAEEDDLQFRFRKAGFRTVLINTPVWQNVREAAFPIEQASFLAMRNSIRYATKNLGVLSGLRQALAVAIEACGRYRGQNLVMRVNRRSRPFSPAKNLPIVLRAYLWNLLQLPRTMVARRDMLRRVALAKEFVKEASCPQTGQK